MRNRAETKRFRTEVDGLCNAERSSLKTGGGHNGDKEKEEEGLGNEHGSGDEEEDKAEDRVIDTTVQMAEAEETQATSGEAEVNARQREGTAPRTGIGVPRSRAKEQRPPPVARITVEEFRKQQRRQHGLAQIPGKQCPAK